MPEPLLPAVLSVMVDSMMSNPPEAIMSPPPSPSVVFPEIVELAITDWYSSFSKYKPPPCPSEWFPENVELYMIRLVSSEYQPPPLPPVVFPENVELRTVTT
jgi:hypothetical protein